MNISINEEHKVTLDKAEMANIKTPSDYLQFLENMNFLFIKLFNYCDDLKFSPEEARYLKNMENNMGYFLLRKGERHGG